MMCAIFGCDGDVFVLSIFYIFVVNGNLTEIGFNVDVFNAPKDDVDVEVDPRFLRTSD